MNQHPATKAGILIIALFLNGLIYAGGPSGIGLDALPPLFIPNLNPPSEGKNKLDEEAVTAFALTTGGWLQVTRTGRVITSAQGREKDREDLPEHKQRLICSPTGNKMRKNLIPGRLTDPNKARFNFMVGPQENWKKGLPSYNQMVFDQAWEGISLTYQLSTKGLSLEFHLDPGSNPEDILLETGAEALELGQNGEILARLGEREISLAAPRGWQVEQGEQKPIPVAFRLSEPGSYGIKPTSYNHLLPLVIHYEIEWCAFFGDTESSMQETIDDIVLDSEDNIYLAGAWGSGDVGLAGNGLDTSWNGGLDAFVVKLNPDATQVIYGTFLGGLKDDSASALLVDDAGRAYITGTSYSTDFPISISGHPILGTAPNGFLTVLNPTGDAIVYSSTLGLAESEPKKILKDENDDLWIAGQIVYNGSLGLIKHTIFCARFDGNTFQRINHFGIPSLDQSTDFLGDFAISPTGEIVIVGYTANHELYLTNDALFQYKGDTDGFLGRFSKSGEVNYLSYMGTSSFDKINAMALDAEGNIYLGINTSGTNFPITPGTYAQTPSTPFNSILVKLDPTAKHILYSTFFGASKDIKVDAQGRAFIMGESSSDAFPTTPGAPDSTRGLSEVFVSVMNEDATDLIYSTFLGGQEDELGTTLTLDSGGGAIIGGVTYSEDFPQTNNSVLNNQLLGPSDAFITKINATGNAFIFSGLTGSTTFKANADIAAGPDGSIYVCGQTRSLGVPFTEGLSPDQPSGDGDAYLVRLNPGDYSFQAVTVFGGTGEDSSVALSVDGAGNPVLAGNTDSQDFPRTAAHIGSGHLSGFVARFTADLGTMNHAYTFGGSASNQLRDLELDSEGNAYVVGFTSSPDFPTTAGVIDTNASDIEGFILKFDNVGKGLLWSTLLGGSDQDEVCDIAIDAEGAIYLAGLTNSTDIPKAAGTVFPISPADNYTVFVNQITPDGTTIQNSGFLIGSAWTPLHMATDESQIYVVGRAFDSLATTAGAYDETYNEAVNPPGQLGNGDGFLLGFNKTTLEPGFATYLGGQNLDVPITVDVDANGVIFITGYTASTDFPTTPNGFDISLNGRKDIFTVQVNNTGSSLLFGSFLGGFLDDFPSGTLLLDQNLLLVGESNSIDFATGPGCPNNYSRDAFLMDISLCSNDIGIRPSSMELCEGEELSLTALVSDSVALGYQWLKDGVPLPGFTSRQLVISEITDQDRGNYSCQVLTGCGTEVSETVPVWIDVPLELISPLSRVVCLGSETLFQVAGTGLEKASFLWYQDGNPMYTETRPILFQRRAYASSAGTYFCRVTNNCSQVDTNPAILELVPFIPSLTAPAFALGLSAPRFELTVECADLNELDIAWISDPATPMILDGSGVTLSPPPKSTIGIEAILTDTEGQEARAYGRLLVSTNPGFRDYNDDGHNDLQDLWDLLALWNQQIAPDEDGDGDGFVSILDMLYLNLSESF